MTNSSIVVCGQKFSIGCKVVLWDEPNGLNAYDTSTVIIKTENRKTGKEEVTKISGKRYSDRSLLPMSFTKLQKMVTQFFLHHDGMYHARDTFNVLHNQRGLSVHFILDDDGTLYQTLDIKEKAWHGGSNNPISIGIEIANRANAGKYPDAYDEYHQKKYKVGPRKKMEDIIQGERFKGFCFNDAQYNTLINLGIGICSIFPINKDFPKNNSGNIIKHILSNPLGHNGFICHYNTSKSKWDPVCFDHERFINGIKLKNTFQESTFEINDWAAIQMSLKRKGYDPGKIDGVFGPKTSLALVNYQTDYMYISIEEAKKSLLKE